MHRSLPNRMWYVAGQLLILLLLFPAVAGAVPDRTAESMQSAPSADHSSGSAHDCCLPATDPVSDPVKPLNHCTGTFFCTCSLQATASSKGAVPAPDQPLYQRVITSNDLYIHLTERARSDAFLLPPGSSPPLWLAHQALLN